MTAILCIYYVMAMFGFVSHYDGKSFNSLQLGFLIMYFIVIVLAVYAAYKSYKGFDYRYPIIGRFIETH